jgi:hypothetical protein
MAWPVNINFAGVPAARGFSNLVWNVAPSAGLARVVGRLTSGCASHVAMEMDTFEGIGDLHGHTVSPNSEIDLVTYP